MYILVAEKAAPPANIKPKYQIKMKKMAPSSSSPLHSSPSHFISMTPVAGERTSCDFPTPLHHSPASGSTGKPFTPNRPEPSGSVSSGDGSISCNKCRPHVREKFPVVPLDGKHSFSTASPTGIFKSIISSVTRKSPKSEEHWKAAMGDVSHKLVQATRKRDEAVLEVSRLKHSMAELEKKLNKLEIYCHTLKSGLGRALVPDNTVIESFLLSVSESRSSVRSLALQLRHMGDKLPTKLSLSKTSLILHLEALLNRIFFEDFESIGFQKNSATYILNPSDRSAANLASYRLLRGLTWEEVLSKGTRHYSEELSGFCDRKMSGIVGALEWTRAWPEGLLQAFFAAAKGVWMVHLLASAVHPCLPIFRVESGVRFDGVYMEDVAGEKAGELVPVTVRIMVAPGFYVFDNLIKCKVLCRYYTN